MPTTPQSAAGWRIDPPVSEPRAIAAKPAATAAAEPPLDPPGTRAGSCGLRVGPKAEFSVDDPMANSSRFVLPTTTAPAALSSSTTVASYGGRQPSRILDEHVVGMARVQRLSFKATGTPARGPTGSPRATAESTSSAAARASSARTRLKAFSSRSRLDTSSRCSSTIDLADLVPARTSPAIDDAGPLTGPRRVSVALGTARPPQQAPQRAPRRATTPGGARRP